MISDAETFLRENEDIHSVRDRSSHEFCVQSVCRQVDTFFRALIWVVPTIGPRSLEQIIAAGRCICSDWLIWSDSYSLRARQFRRKLVFASAIAILPTPVVESFGSHIIFHMSRYARIYNRIVRIAIITSSGTLPQDYTSGPPVVREDCCNNLAAYRWKAGRRPN